MIYGYIRVSTNKQDTANQQFEINNYCSKKNIIVDKWFADDGVSGTVDYHKRNLNKLLSKLQTGDTIICSELSRLGRSLYMIFELLNIFQKKKIIFITIKENFILEDSINSKVISFAFGLSAEIERNLISMRTKEALARLKVEGIKLGRPKGSPNKHFILEPYKDYIINKKKAGKSNNYIKRKLHCHINTLKHALEIWNI